MTNPAPNEMALRERCLALAVEAFPDDAARRAEEFLAFIQGESCDHDSSPRGTSHRDQGSD